MYISSTLFVKLCRHSLFTLSSSLSPFFQSLTHTNVSIILSVGRHPSTSIPPIKSPSPISKPATSNPLPMLFFEDLWESLFLDHLGSKTGDLSGQILQSFSQSMNTNENCTSSGLELCRDDSTALVLKLVAIISLLISGVSGIAIPLVGRECQFLKTDSSLLVAAKAFGTGVILATGFVHMLAGGIEALSSPCLPEYPWSKFPFPGFFAMMASLATLLLDFVGTQYHDRKQGLNPGRDEHRLVQSDDTISDPDSGIVPVIEVVETVPGPNGKVFGVEEGGGMHVVGMHAHHRHSHAHGKDACEGHVPDLGHEHGHGHSHGFGDGDVESGGRHIVVSQILELGILSHSIIIGLSLGVSQSPCTIRPLIAALSFHQFFEGFALGGCISQAQFKTSSAIIMACFFAITTPTGIGAGTAIASFYNPHSPGALVAEGILDSLSAGILVYMALVDLIAVDFLSKRMSCNFRLQMVSYFMLFLGAGLMALLAIWA